MITTKGDTVIAKRYCDFSGLTECNQSAGDTKIVLHLGHGFAIGHIYVYVGTFNCDMVVLCIWVCPR